MQISINGHLIGDNHPTYVVAEIGQNHNGDVYTAVRLIKTAVDAGCDAVKFQLRSAEHEFTSQYLALRHSAPEAAYGKTYLDHRHSLDLLPGDLRHIKNRIEYNKWPIAFFATPCDVVCVQPLEAMNVPLYKIASKDLTNIPLIEEVGKTRKPVFLSTGMANWKEIDAAVDAITPYTTEIVLMQCCSQYPCDMENVNLRAIETLKKRYGTLVGISDHTIGIQVPAWATFFGACVIEKHITLSRAQRGTDHAGSLEPHGIELVVRDVRNAEMAVGTGDKYCHSGEFQTRLKLRRSLVLVKDIAEGEVIGEADLAFLAPGNGLSWADRDKVIGSVAAKDLPAGHTLKTEDVCHVQLS